MYGDDSEQDSRHTSSPLGHYTTSLRGGSGGPIGIGAYDRTIYEDNAPSRPSIRRKNTSETKMQFGGLNPSIYAQSRPALGRGGSWEHHNGSPSPPLASRGRSPSETATSSFPLNDIDYESSPAAVAQELSNLQALRRMSMDVAAAGDPDLPSQLNPTVMPSAPPSPAAAEDDASRLFWVPARLHPELAPKEFKSFLEGKAEQIQRRSGELSAFTTPSSSRSNSLSTEDSSAGLNRKKSMLSRQIDSSVGYQDGADRLEHKKSLSGKNGIPDPNLQELESLVAGGLPRLSLESQGDEESGDVILPSVPGNSLKRSTRTTYRRGGTVKGRADRNTYAQRAAKKAGTGGEDTAPPVPEVPPLPSFTTSDVENLARTLKDPSNAVTTSRGPTNFSRPAGRSLSPTSKDVGSSAPTVLDLPPSNGPAGRASSSSLPERPSRKQVHIFGRDSPAPSSPIVLTERKPIPQIVEVPPPEEKPTTSKPPTLSQPGPASPFQPALLQHPERKSSREDRPMSPAPQRPPLGRKQSSVIITKRPPSGDSGVSPQTQSPQMVSPQTVSPQKISPQTLPPQTKPHQSLDQMSANPAPLPGNDMSTSNLSFIPTLTVDKGADNKKKEETKKSGWGWLLGKEEAEKAKPEKPKAKIVKPPQSHDNTRLDLLQSSIDGTSKGRESLVLDRDGLKLEEERKKESQRKSSESTHKKEKEGLFSSIFGGKKSKAEKETHKRQHSRGLSPEPPHKVLKPDIDYNWTRFSILEERAIYRMAHIKLANPRRALYSQVLLSNFMYSYLAKVQQMHPQMNLPTSAKQAKKQEREHKQSQHQQQQQQQQQPDEFTQYQRYQQVSMYARCRST